MLAAVTFDPGIEAYHRLARESGRLREEQRSVDRLCRGALGAPARDGSPDRFYGLPAVDGVTTVAGAMPPIAIVPPLFFAVDGA